MSVYPATNSNEAVELIIDGGNQLHDIINETADKTVTTESGEIPSVRKAIADSLMFLEPLPWKQGESETNFLQIRSFNSELYWAPSATISTPKPMGVSPVGDTNWKLSPLRLSKSSILSALGKIDKGFWDENPKLENEEDFVVDRNTGDVFGAINLPYQVDSATNPDPNALLGTELVDVSEFTDISSVYRTTERKFNSISEMLSSSDLKEFDLIFVSEVGAKFSVRKGTSPYPLIDKQSAVETEFYFKLLPIEGTNYSYSFIGAGGRNDLTISDENSEVMTQLINKIMAESPVIAGNVKMSGGQYWFSKSVTAPNAKHITIIGEESTLSYGSFESKTIIYSDNTLEGDYVFDFDSTQFMGLKDIGFRGDPTNVPTKGAFFLGKRGSFAPGFGNAFIERINVSRHLDGGLLKNCGISIVRDFQASYCFGRGLAIEGSGDSCLYNVYCNTNNKDTTDISLSAGTGLYIGMGSNNTTVLGGKLEFNSKGLVIDGSNGVIAQIQYDYNYMANVIVKARNDTNEACRSTILGGSRILSGGVTAGFEFSGVYTDSTFGSVSVDIQGGSIQAAGNGAYDNSTSGDIGPSIGILANGNDTHSNEVTYSGIASNMGTSFFAEARGSGTRVVISGTLPNTPKGNEVNGGQVVFNGNRKIPMTPAFAGTSGSVTYRVQQGSYRVASGTAYADIQLEVNSVGDIAGDLRIIGLPLRSTNGVTDCATIGVFASILNASSISGYVEFNGNEIVLWKYTANGGVSRLNASDLQNGSLLRISATYPVQ